MKKSDVTRDERNAPTPNGDTDVRRALNAPKRNMQPPFLKPDAGGVERLFSLKPRPKVRVFDCIPVHYASSVVYTTVRARGSPSHWVHTAVLTYIPCYGTCDNRVSVCALRGKTERASSNLVWLPRRPRYYSSVSAAPSKDPRSMKRSARASVCVLRGIQRELLATPFGFRDGHATTLSPPLPQMIRDGDGAHRCTGNPWPALHFVGETWPPPIVHLHVVGQSCSCMIRSGAHSANKFETREKRPVPDTMHACTSESINCLGTKRRR